MYVLSSGNVLNTVRTNGIGLPALGLCDQIEDYQEWDDHGDHYQWVKDGDRICMQPRKEDSDKHWNSPDGLCFAAKELEDGARLRLAKDGTGNPIDWAF